MLSTLKKNPDGSLTIYMQKDEPSADKKVELVARAQRTDLRGDATVLAP